LDEVLIHPLFLVHKGRVSGVIDAAEVRAPGDPRVLRSEYEQGDLTDEQWVELSRLARKMGFTAFARAAGTTRRVASRLASGQRTRTAIAKRIVERIRINFG
jgi:hypothetical protein